MKSIRSNILAGLTLAAAASVSLAQTVPQPPGMGFALVGRGGGIVLNERAPVNPPLPPAGNVWWDNGAADGLGALQSQTLGSFTARVADDYILSSGRWHMVTGFKVCMFVSLDVTTPNVSLEIYNDCNGKPGALATTLLSTNVQLLASNAPFQGFGLYEVTFNTSSFDLADLNGCSRIWLSPFGTGTGTYFWASAGNGHVQGVQGQFKAAPYGYPSWTDVQLIDCCFTSCSDFCFKVIGDVCYTVKDQGEYELAGLPSIQFSNIDLDGARAADNFQISATEGVVAVCRVEGYLATNCDPKRVFAEIYADRCDQPTDVLFRLVNPVYTLQTGVTYAGVPVYLFRWDLPAGVILQGGNNYWFAMAAQSTGSITDRAYFLFKKFHQNCLDIYLTEGVYRNPFMGIDTFKPVSIATGTGDPLVPGPAREFAFRMYGSQVPIAAHPTNVITGDVNGDGIVNTTDLALMLLNFGRNN